MVHRMRRIGVVMSITALAGASIAFTSEGAHATVPDLAQHVAVPAYIPTSDSASWGSLTTANSQLGFITVNEASGPGTAVDTALQSKVNAAHSAGTKVIGYVDTGYLGQNQLQVPTSAPRTTALGDHDITSWVVQVEQDVDRWYSYYGTSMDGIFLDDGMALCGSTQHPTQLVDAYVEINAYIHANHPGSLTVLNPGVTVPECYDETADILVTYEGSASDFLDPNLDAGRKPNTWQLAADPNKFWAIVYGATESQISAVSAQSKSNNDGYIDITSDGADGNPYNTAPTGTYWSSELASTTSSGTAVPGTPSRPYASDVYSTGLVLDWASSASSSVLGYEVYRNGLHVASVGNYYPNDTNFTDVGLTPATAYSYTVKARGRDGLLSAVSTARSVTTDVVWGTAPGAPGTLTGSNVSANGIQLSWTASAVTNDPVAYYDVYINGTRKVTVDSSTTAIHLGYLSTNTAYTFTVKARSTSNAVSAASNTVSATTTNPPAIDGASVNYTATTAAFQANFNLSYPFDSVFIDTDHNATPVTGYTGVSGVGADFMIQNSTLYQYSGTGGGWGWTQLSTDPAATVSGATHSWSVPTSVLGSPASITVVYNVSDGTTSVSLPAITATR